VRFAVTQRPTPNKPFLLTPHPLESWFSADLSPGQEAQLQEALKNDAQLRVSYEAHKAFERQLKDAALRNKIKNIAANSHSNGRFKLFWVAGLVLVVAAAVGLWLYAIAPGKPTNLPHVIHTTPVPLQNAEPFKQADSQNQHVPANETRPVAKPNADKSKKTRTNPQPPRGGFAQNPVLPARKPQYRGFNSVSLASDSLWIERASDLIAAYSAGNDLDNETRTDFGLARLLLLDDKTEEARNILFKRFDTPKTAKDEAEWLLALTFVLEGQTTLAKSALKNIADNENHKFAAAAKRMLD